MVDLVEAAVCCCLVLGKLLGVVGLAYWTLVHR